MESPESPKETLLKTAQAIKDAERQRLANMEPEQAQAEVDAVLVDLGWKIQNPAELVWPGDLADPAEEPDWTTCNK